MNKPLKENARTHRRALNDGVRWDVSGVIEWMMTEGRTHSPKPKAFLCELCERLLEAGAPLLRVRAGFRTLHPQFAAWNMSWVRDSDSVETMVQHGIELSDEFINSPTEHIYKSGKIFRRNLRRLSDNDHALLYGLAEQGGVDYLGMPVVFSDGVMSTFNITTDSENGFSDHDVALFTHLTWYLGPVLEVMSARLIARVLLDTYVGPRTGRKILGGAVRRGDSEIIQAALWFSDLRDFTRLSEILNSEDMLALLNQYFEEVGNAALERGGEILRFVGDAMLIVFPVNEQRDRDGACKDALDAAVDAVLNLGKINQQRRHDDLPSIRCGIGLNTGEVVYGNVGTSKRLDYTVMGPAVNLAARLESLTKTIGQSIVFSRQFADCLEYKAMSHGFYEMKGMAEPREALSLGDDEALSGLAPRHAPA